MVSRFRLDLSKLDDRLRSEVEINGEGIAYLSMDSHFKGDKPTYFVVLDLFGEGGHGIPPALVMNGLGVCEGSIAYKNANVSFWPLQAGDVFFHTHSFVSKCDAIYHHSKFILGDADKFKKYGVNIID